MTREERLQQMDRHLAHLAEHFDAVEIVACRVLPDGSTENYHRGMGNWYARFGLVHEQSLRCQREMIATPLLNPDGPDPEGAPE